MIGRNETDYAVSGGGGYGFGGGGWGIPPVGLFGVIGGRGFGFDGHDGRRDGRCFEECCCDIRADIGETKFKVAETTLGQANALMKELCDLGYQGANNTFQLEKELFGLQKDVLVGDNLLEKSILTQGFQNQLGNCQQTNVLSRQIADCCCETNLNIERTAHATQLRDLENKAQLEAEIAKLKCGQHDILCAIANQAKDTKIELLEKELRQTNKMLDKLEDKSIASRTNCLVTQLGDAAKAYVATQTPTTPFPWTIPVCGCNGF